MLHLVSQARALLTDSSGLQEEAALLGTPALILRNETEWPQWVDAGVNALVGNTYRSLMDKAWPILASDSTLQAMRRKSDAPPSGASLRILRRLESDLGSHRLPHTSSQPGVAAAATEPIQIGALS